MLFTADALIAHAVGDYILQSDWEANEKTKRVSAALAHVITYALPFLFLTTSWKALAVIGGTHFVIDHWRLARYVCWAKNWIAPKWIDVTTTYAITMIGARIPVVVGPDNLIIVLEDEGAIQVSDVKPIGPNAILPKKIKKLETVTTKLRNYPWSECVGTGYHSSRPPFMSVWLLIIADNIMHVIINALALKYLG